MTGRTFMIRARSAGVLFVTSALMVLGAVLAVAATTGLDRSLLGREFLLVTSGSMAPGLAPGDVVVVRTRLPAGEPVPVGEVVTFARPAAGPLVTHRVVGVSRQSDGSFSYLTKGDANEAADAEPVPSGRVIGRVESVLPSGRVLVAMADPRTAVPVVLAVVLLEAALIVRPRPTAGANDPSEQEKQAHPQGGNPP